MVRIINTRGTGKTHKLMSVAKDNDAIFVCGNPYAMAQKSLAYGITGLTFMSYTDFIRDKDLKSKFVVDEMESFVRYLTGSNELVGYTLSNED